MIESAQIPVRRIGFDYPEEIGVAWTPHQPEFACAANSVSLLMPFMEPYFVRSIAAALPRLDPDLAARTRAYLGQETQHHVQHQRFNEALTSRYRSLRFVERRAEQVYRWLGRTRSAEFNLGFAASSEAIAYSAARWSAERRRQLFSGADPVVASLFLWHLAEEVEHKSVAFDVFRSCEGRRRHYLGAGLLALVLVLVFVGVGTTIMLGAERRLFHPVAWFRLTGWAITFAFELVPNLALSLFASHHPDQWVDPLWYEVWLREFDASSGSLPLWMHSTSQPDA